MCADQEGEKSNWLDNTSRATYNVSVARCGGRNRECGRKKKNEEGKETSWRRQKYSAYVKRGKVEFVLLQFLIWWMMLCAIRGNAHSKTNDYHFNRGQENYLATKHTLAYAVINICGSNTEADSPWDCGKKKSCSHGKNTFKFQLFHSVTSWCSLFLLVQIFVSCIWSRYIYSVRNTHIHMAIAAAVWTMKSNKTVLSVDPDIQLQRANIPRWQTMVFCLLSWLSHGRQSGASFEKINSSETIKIKFSSGLLKYIIFC